VQEATLSVWIPMSNKIGTGTNFRVGNRIAGKKSVPFTRDKDLERRLPAAHADERQPALFDALSRNSEAASGLRQASAMIIIPRRRQSQPLNLRETKSLLEEADVPVFAVMGIVV